MIRKMTIADYNKVYELWKLCSGMGLNNLDDSEEGISRFLIRNPDTCFVAVMDDVMIGVILAGHDGRRGYIYHTAVNPDFRKQGVGRSLVDAVIAELKRTGIHKIALVVFDRNRDGNLFWEKMGFSVRDDLVYRNKSLSEIIRMDT